MNVRQLVVSVFTTCTKVDYEKMRRNARQHVHRRKLMWMHAILSMPWTGGEGKAREMDGADAC